MTKLQVNNKILYYQLSIKPNVYTIGITLSMWIQHNFETIFTYNYVLNIQDAIRKIFGSREREFSMEVNAYFGPKWTNRLHATPSYGLVK